MQVDPPLQVVPFVGNEAVQNYPGSSCGIDGRNPHQIAGGWLNGKEQRNFFICARYFASQAFKDWMGKCFGADIMKIIRDHLCEACKTFNRKNLPNLKVFFRLSGTTVQNLDIAMWFQPDGKLVFGDPDMIITLDIDRVMEREPITTDPRAVLDDDGAVISKPSDFQRVTSPNGHPTLRFLGLPGDYRWGFEQTDVTISIRGGGCVVAGGFVRPFNGQLILTIRNNKRDSFLEFKVNTIDRRLGWPTPGYGIGHELLH
jgi:hypothetical protein